MSNKKNAPLRFNFGFLLEGNLGEKREYILDYPSVTIDDVTLRPLQGTVTASRNSRGIYIEGQLRSTIVTECSRCLMPITLPVTIELSDLFYYPPTTAPEGEYTIPATGFLDLSPLVREMGLLAIPIQPICKPDCLGFCMECGQNLNEGDCHCEEETLDPRLSALSKLLDN
ncbi:MAG: DUF177 domain-containing protein [Chloroflexi bacterium]|nr:DUF177 domain-containing protein [Chloroflexota bacterium]MBP8054809.1 DUF177 domain-containing protein [Chloroflexota bacterium]